MEKLIEQVKELAAAELARAISAYGAHHHSAHEAYAVILEERDEAMKEAVDVYEGFGGYWAAIIANDKERRDAALRSIEDSAILAACEFIQVAAMAKKSLSGYEKGE